MKKLSVFLVSVGIVLIAYPLLDRGYTWYKQNKAFKELNNNEVINSEDTINDYVGLNEIFDNRVDVQDNDNVVINSENKIETVKTDKKIDKKIDKKDSEALGILEIDKINLKLPILYGASSANLKVGAAQISGTSPIGEIGNAAFAGHRSHTYGRFFNRLNEVEVGDEIIIIIGKKTYKYQVYEKLVVKPDDISVLYKNDKDKVITLVTCDPVYNPTHRLVIHGVQKSE